MNSLNKVQIIGNLTQDIELKQTQNGTAVTSTSVATNRGIKQADGSYKDVPEFHYITLWGKLAEVAAKYIRKGNKVYIEGRLQTRSWEDQSGQKKYKTEIVAEQLILLTPRPAGSPQRASSEPVDASTLPDIAPEKRADEALDDLPF